MSKRDFVTWLGTSQHYSNQIPGCKGNKNTAMKKIVSLALIMQGLIGLNAIGQKNTSSIDTSVTANAVDAGWVTRSAGTQYAASGWKRLWWGDHYRKEWVTPVSFPVLHISSFNGGLQPVKAGGGHETKTLRLISSQGKEYVLRTMDKSLDVLVPNYLKGTYVNDIVNDQVSTAHPYGPVAVARLADAAHIMHANPQIYFVADDSSFGEFRNVFTNRLCLLEERPSGKGWEHTDMFGDADDIVNTEDLLEKVFASSKNSVDQHSFLKVRLFDMLINDWDRHEDQWVWALHPGNTKNVFTAIGRDRDQAFSKTDGIGTYMISRPWALRPLKNFTPAIHDARGLNFSARNLDRQFLNQLTKEDWKNTIDSLQSSLSDSAIRSSVMAMPEEANQFSGETIIKRLIQRRENLSTSGMKYYSTLAKRVVINGSAKDESFIINTDNKKVDITGLRRSGQDTFYHRVFYRNETKEINIYGLDGADEFIVRGSQKNRFTIRLIGDDKNSEYKSEVAKISGKKIKVYDSLMIDDITRKVFKQKRWDTSYHYDRKSVKYDWYIPLITPGYNVDDGFTIGLGLLYSKQSWGKQPYGWRQQFSVNYSTGTRAIGFEYAGLFKEAFGKLDLDLNAFFKGPSYTFRYYGLGNETELKINDRSFYKVKANDFYVSPGVSRTWRDHVLRVGLQYEAVEILRDQSKFITSALSDVDPKIFDPQHFVGVNVKWNFFNGKDPRFPLKGFNIATGLSYLHNVDNSDNLLKLNGSIAFYYTFFHRLTFAHRTGAETNFGEFNFYHAATLGLDQNLRGFWKSRFNGKSSFYQNTELRLRLANLRGYYLRGNFGLFSFIDDGRVWIEDEQSSTLHVGYGGGVYFVPYNLIALTVFYSTSKETNMVTVRAGFFF